MTLVLFRDGEACVQCQDSLSGLQPAENQDEDGCSGGHQRSGETGPNQTEVRTCYTHTHTERNVPFILLPHFCGVCSYTRGIKHCLPKTSYTQIHVCVLLLGWTTFIFMYTTKSLTFFIYLRRNKSVYSQWFKLSHSKYIYNVKYIYVCFINAVHQKKTFSTLIIIINVYILTY